MQRGSLAAVFLMGLLHTTPIAGGETPREFVDGLWTGGIAEGSETEGLKECWASTTSLDGTTFTLARRSDLNWYLRLSNANWQLPTRHRYAMVAQVDYYPRLRIAAVAKSKTSLEIADLDENSSLGPRREWTLY